MVTITHVLEIFFDFLPCNSLALLMSQVRHVLGPFIYSGYSEYLNCGPVECALKYSAVLGRVIALSFVQRHHIFHATGFRVHLTIFRS
jgi:hypothetical protein